MFFIYEIIWGLLGPCEKILLSHQQNLGAHPDSGAWTPLLHGITVSVLNRYEYRVALWYRVSCLHWFSSKLRHRFFIDTSLESVKGFDIGRQEDGTYAILLLYLILPWTLSLGSSIVSASTPIHHAKYYESNWTAQLHARGCKFLWDYLSMWQTFHYCYTKIH